jgi:hypothetical protein
MLCRSVEGTTGFFEKGALFLAMKNVANGSFETCPPILRMSVHRGNPEDICSQ